MDMSLPKYGPYRRNYTGLQKLAYVKDLSDTLSKFIDRWKNKEATTANVSALSSGLLRLIKYLNTGNTEWLMDAANQLMIEFKRPQVKGAGFRATDSGESPGLIGISEGEMERL